MGLESGGSELGEVLLIALKIDRRVWYLLILLPKIEWKDLELSFKEEVNHVIHLPYPKGLTFLSLADQSQKHSCFSPRQGDNPMLPALIICRKMQDLTLESSQNSGYYSTVLFIFARIHTYISKIGKTCLWGRGQASNYKSLIKQFFLCPLDLTKAVSQNI